MNKISSAFFNLTNACNLACRYCFVEQNPDYMTLETAQYAADWLAGNAAESGDIPSITYFGGEPMLCWSSVIVPLTDYIREKYGSSYELSITSNCTLMDEERAKYLSDNNVGLLLSMDGDKETQDCNRPCRDGKSSFDILEPKLPIILKYWPQVTFRSTVTPATCSDLYHNILFAEAKGFKNYFVMPNCFEQWSDDEIRVLKVEMRKYSNHYIECMRSGLDSICFGELEKFFGKIRKHNQAIINNEWRQMNLCHACGKCGLGASRFAGVNINGDLIGCQEFFSRSDNILKIGNIYTGVDDEARQKLMDMWDESPAVGDDCAHCPLDRICDGGCVANNYMATGDIHHLPVMQCVWERVLFDEAVFIMQTLGAERNERFRAKWRTYG